MKKIIVVTYVIDDEKYPYLAHINDNRIEFYIQHGYIQLGDTYQEVPSDETILDNPVGIVVVA